MHPNLEAVAQIIPGLIKLLGTRYEGILYDMTSAQSTAVRVEGDVTHRKIGEPGPEALLAMLLTNNDRVEKGIHRKAIWPDGRVLRTSTLFVRDEQAKVIGALCLNQDLTDFIVARNVMEESTAFEQEDADALGVSFSRGIGEAMESVVDAEVARLQKPVACMQKDDKLTVVAKLEHMGIFAIKNAVEYVAECLGVTNYTVYNYLKEARGKAKNA